MIKKIGTDELKTGVYICGLEKEGGKDLFFMNNILVKTEDDLKYYRSKCKSVYVDVEEPRPAQPVMEKKAAVKPAPVEPQPEAPEAAEVLPEAPIVSGIEPVLEPMPLAGTVIEDEKEIPVAVAQAPQAVKAAETPQDPCPEPAVDENPGQAEAGEPEDEPPPLKEQEVSHAVLPLIKADPAGGDGESTDPEIKDKVEFKEELKRAKKIRNEAVDLVKEFLNTVRTGKGIEADKVHSTMGKMVDSIFSNQDALASLARLKSFDNYTFTHSVNVAILSITMGRHMGFKREDIHDLGVGAILHDVGKMLVPENILNKPGALTESEFEVMKKHTTLGAELLERTRNIKEESRYVALQHQEKYDGTGYPGKLKGSDIHIFGRISAVADVYDAMTSKRVYKPGMHPEEALKKMYFLRGKHFESQMVERLIKCLGIYPIGTLVELNTGELALVRMTNHTHPVQPLVMMLFDKEKKPCPQPFEIDLKDDLGRWITASRNMENMEAIVDGLIAC